MIIRMLLCLSLAMAPQVHAQAAPALSEPVATPVTTRHKGRFGGEVVAYSAVVSETVLKDDQNRPAATIYSTAYLREDGGDRANRPVIFLFNGGPGASSAPLHLALGPMRSSRSQDVDVDDDEAPARMVENPESLLSDADLVFIDPVGTGFSRVLPGGSGNPYWSVDGDARSIRDFMRDWLARNRRAGSPVFICGESYGGFRLGTLLKDLGDLEVDGAFFISSMLDRALQPEPAPLGDLPYVIALPTMASIAAYHRRIDSGGRSIEQVFQDAVKFSVTEYAVALLSGRQLADQERGRIAQRMSAMIGLPPAFILSQNLRVSNQAFVTTLLAGQGLRVGRTDGRYTGNLQELAKNTPPFDDPAMSRGSVRDLITDYLVRDLEFPTKRVYATLAMDVNSKWDWTTRDPVGALSALPGVVKAMKENPQLRIFVAGGYYDLATPIFGGIYAMDHADLPAERVIKAAYESGHSMYHHRESLKKLAADMREFIRARAR